MVNTIIIAGCTIVVQLIIAAWTLGGLSKEVSNQREWLAATSERVDEHETRLSRLEGATN